MKRFVAGLCAGVALGAAALVAVPPAHATREMQTKAKAAGIEATNCLYCHNEKLPTKAKVTNNDRGKWLVAEKEKRKAKQVDVAWLKDYVTPK